jgi:hypothetical protein
MVVVSKRKIGRSHGRLMLGVWRCSVTCWAEDRARGGAVEHNSESPCQPFTKLQLLEHVVRQPFQKLRGIGTLPAVSYFVTVISHENRPEKSALRSPPASFLKTYGR